jgi:predicted dehydrogenase
MKKIRCAIAGLGRIGWMLERDRLREKPCTHAGAILDNDECVLVGGCDIDPKRLRAFSREYCCSHIFTDITELLEKTSPDILHIATPTETHYGIIETALSFKVKLIVCEKPLAENSHDAFQIATWQRQGETKILLNHERRYSRDYLRVKRKIESRAFGELLSIASSLYMGENTTAHDILLRDGTHLIDIIQFLSGTDLKLLTVERFHGTKAETVVVTSSANSVPVTLEIGSGRNYIQFEMDLRFARGRIRIGNGLYEEYASGASPYYEGMRSLRATGAKRPQVTGYFANMLKDAVRCIRDRQRVPLSSAVDGYSVLKFIDAVKRYRR